MTVGADLASLNTRVRDILYNGRGITGATGSHSLTFTAHAQLVAIPVGTFLPSPQNAPLEDPNIDAEAFDRRARLHFAPPVDDGINEFDGSAVVDVSFEVHVGYLFGKALKNANLFIPHGAETSAGIYDEPEIRSAGDSMQIRRALGLGELYQGTDAAPSIMLILPRAPSTSYLPSGGRFVLTVPFTARLVKSLSANSAP